MSLQSDPKNLPFYQYVVPASLFIVAAVTMSFYFRWRSAATARHGRELGGASARDGAEVDPLPKPLLHDAHVGDADMYRLPAGGGSVALDWDEIMPLSVMHSVDGDLSPAWTHKGDRDSPPSRVLVSVIIRMPEPSRYEETSLPCLELGLVEVDSTRGTLRNLYCY